MRFLVRSATSKKMHGVDATESIVEIGRNRCVAEGLADRIAFSVADACETGLLADHFDFAWARTPGVTSPTREKLIREAPGSSGRRNHRLHDWSKAPPD